MNRSMFSLLLVLTTIFLAESHVAGGTKVPRIRGIPVSKTSLYSPDRDFQCLDGSQIIPFARVNDDYCDCGDGSDEPGTAACSNGFFYCQNLGYQASYIPSKWVNDGVCNCCDASDEYDSNKTCVDNCNELGMEARLAAQRIAELAREGNKVRMQMIGRGKQLKVDYQERLGKLRVDAEEAERTKKEKEVLKQQAEERETAAMEKYKPPPPEQPAEPKQDDAQTTEQEAKLYFKLLDSDESNTITVAELKTRTTFDNDRNGEVTDEEALFFLNQMQEVNWEQFLEFCWPNMKPFIMMEKGLFKPETEKPKEEETKDHADSKEHTEDHEDEDDDEEDEPEGNQEEQEERQPNEEAEETETEQQEEEPPVQYDEETQAIIDEASAARRNFEEAERAVRDIQGEINRLEDKLERDYGPEEEFASLDGECFEYADLEYIYTLCMFDRATQKSKSGGSDVNLGIWSEWVGTDRSKYTKMKYDRGLTCWNGPSRSTLVTLTCGTENKLVSVTEPSRCEYAFEFVTPTVCLPNVIDNDKHDEL